MKLIDTLTIKVGAEERRIELLQGDLTEIPPEHAVDVLVVSAFSRDYFPTATSLIGALHNRGLSVHELANAKEVDLRSTCSCWLSHEIPVIPGLRFKRILCFEPAAGGHPPEIVGDIFRALVPFVGENHGIRRIAIPLVAAGDQGYSVSSVLIPLLQAACHWLSIGLPLEVIKIVSFSYSSATKASSVFRAVRLDYNALPVEASSISNTMKKVSDVFGKFSNAIARPVQDSYTGRNDFDVFLSYSRKDRAAADSLTAGLQENNLRIFVDVQSIDRGVAWQQKIFEALDACERMVAIYSPDYIQSKVCQEEFNIAWARGRKESKTIIFPIYWASTSLPTYMSMLNYVDCRERNKTELDKVTTEILRLIKSSAISNP